MIRPFVRLMLVCVAAALLPTFVVADDLYCEGGCPTCGKVCKLLCSTKKLTATCYGCETKDICIPGPSRRGCKHCATCYGKPPANACDDCQNCVPKCEFCWRDWFACGCAQPRTVRVLTKYQAEKEICWYHWEVVDAATCCDCVSTNGGDKNKKQPAHIVYKPAPDDSQIGDVLTISDAEWVKLAAVLSPDQTDAAASAFAERIQRLWKK